MCDVMIVYEKIEVSCSEIDICYIGLYFGVTGLSSSGFDWFL